MNDEHTQAGIRGALGTWHFSCYELAVCDDCQRIHSIRLLACPACTGRHSTPLWRYFGPYGLEKQRRTELSRQADAICRGIAALAEPAEGEVAA